MLIHNADITGSLTINGIPYNTGSFTGSFYGDGSQLSGVTSYTNADTLAFIQGYSGSYSGSFSGSFFGDGSNLSGVTSYTDADTLAFINSLDVVSGSIQTVSTVSDTFTSATSYTVTHNFGTKEVIVSVYENDTVIFPSTINTPTTNTVTITFPEPVTGRVVVVKAGHIVSGSINYNSVLNKPTLVSGSSQISFTGITNKPTLVSGSSQITYSGLTGIPSGIVSGSTQVAQFGYATTGSNQFNGNQSITGSLTVSGQVVAQTLNVQQVTSSIVFSSGSNIFGNSLSNTQQFTGSVGVTGSLTVNTSGVEFQVTNTGVNLGNALTDSHIISGSLRVNPNGLFVSGSGNVGIGTITPSSLLHITDGYVLIGIDKGVRFDTSGASGHPELSVDSSAALNFKNTAGSTNLTIANSGAATFSNTVTATGGTEIPNGQFYRARRSSSNLLIDLLGIESGTDNTRLLITGDFNIKNGSLATLLNMTTAGVVTFSSNSNSTISNTFQNTDTTNASTRNYFNIVAGTNRISLYSLHSDNNYINTAYGDLYFQMNASTSTTNPMIIKSSGNVGIGNTSPQGLLQIGANALFNNADASNAFNLKQTSTTAATGIYLERSGERRGYYMYMGGSLDSLTFQRNNVGTKADVMSLTRDGNVGIGTDSPSTKLNTNLSVEGALLAYLVNTSATFNAGANIAVTHNSSTLGTNTAAGILLANNNNSNNAISPLIAFSAKSESTSYNHTYAAIYGQKRASGADANWNTGDLIIATGNATGPIERLRVLAAGGLTFNGDSAAANALNDYEEGSFTPSSLGTNFSSISVVFGRYIKIGNQVTIHCRWTVTPGSTGMKYVAFDLPFAFVNNSNVGFTGAVSNYNEGQTAGSSNVGTTVRNSSGSTTQQYAEAYYTSTNVGSLFLSMTYFTFF